MGNFGGHCDNFRVISDYYDSSKIKFHFRINFFVVCFASFQCFCLFIFCYFKNIFSMSFFLGGGGGGGGSVFLWLDVR